MLRPRSWALSAAWLLVVGTASRAEEVSLRWKLQAGETLGYECRQKHEIKAKATGQDSENTNETVVNMTWVVKSISEEGTAEINMVVNRVRAEIKLGAQKIKYDSREKTGDDPGARILDAIYGPVIDAEYALKLDARGQVVSAKVPARITEALAKSPFLATADAGSVLTETGLKTLLALVIPVFPEKPVAKGAAWSTAVDLTVPPLKLTSAFKDELMSLDDDKAKIVAAIETTVHLEPKAPLTVEVKKQSGSRDATFDTKTGRVTASTTQQKLNLTLGFMNPEIEQAVAIETQLTLVPRGE